MMNRTLKAQPNTSKALPNTPKAQPNTSKALPNTSKALPNTSKALPNTSKALLKKSAERCPGAFSLHNPESPLHDGGGYGDPHGHQTGEKPDFVKADDEGWIVPPAKPVTAR